MIDLQRFQPINRGIFSLLGSAPHIETTHYDRLIKCMSPSTAGFVILLRNADIQVNLREIYANRNKDPVAALELIRLFLNDDALDVDPPTMAFALTNAPNIGPMKTMARHCFSGVSPAEGKQAPELTGPEMAAMLDLGFRKAHAAISKPELDPRWVTEVAAGLALWKIRGWLWSNHGTPVIGQRVIQEDGSYDNAYTALMTIAENAPHHPDEVGPNEAPLGIQLVTLLADNPHMEETAIRLLDAFGIDMDWYNPKYTYNDILVYLNNGTNKLFRAGFNVNRMLFAAVKSIY